jgi:conjugative transfer pilus assembly protein TraH
MKKIIFIFILLVTVVVSSDMKSWSNGLINASSESAGYFSTQTRGYYTVGSQSFRINGQGAFSLAHIEMPQLTVGCGGIDMIWGGFSFLTDPKYLVAKLKGIGYAAAAYAFKMAITSLCKDCGEIMDALEAVSESVNNFNLDTCSIGKSVGGQAVDFFTDARQSNLQSGQSNNPAGEKEKSNTNVYADYINGIATSISSAGGSINDAKKLVENKASLGSFISQAIAKKDKTGEYAQKLFGTDSSTGEGKLLGVIRYLVGDVVGYKSYIGGEMIPKYEQIPAGRDIDKVLESLIHGDVIPYKTLKLDSDFKYVKRSTLKNFNFTGGLYQLYKTKLTNIVTKMTSYQAINTADRKFIQMQPIPIYKMLNVVAIQGNQALLEQVAEQLALRQAIATLNHILWIGGTDLAAELQEISPELLASSEPMVISSKRLVLENIQKVKVLMQENMSNKMTAFKQNVLFMDKIRDYERQIKSQSQSQLLNMMGSFN